MRFLVLLCLLFGGIANAKLYNPLEKSVYKLYIPGDKGTVGTVFITSLNNRYVAVTNNHLCRHFVNSTTPYLIPTELMESKLSTQQKAEQTLLITEYYMSDDADICIMDVDKIKTTIPLSLRDEDLKFGDNVTVYGFSGPSYTMLISEGRVVGTVEEVIYGHTESCDTVVVPRPDMAYNLLCNIMQIYPTSKQYTAYTATAQISPGYSGSPVTKDTYVVGVTFAMRFVNKNHNSGNTMFVPTAILKKAIANSKARMVPVNSDFYKKQIKSADMYNKLTDVINQYNYDLDAEISKILKEGLEH